MSREILFRAKRIDNNEWVEGFYVRIPLINCDNIEELITDKTGTSYEVDHSTVSQYVGIEDVNGNKIFENDVVRDLSTYLIHKDYVENGIESEEVLQEYIDTAKRGIVCFDIENVGSCGCCYPYFIGTGFKAYDISLNECEVIGNKFDNPELIKE